ncbi:GAF and ANTAR domain-containing protein [Streptomyces sviceus]|uniref:GAF and ANTAR domain-containing protein n=1 Tax=Streptomyces sviceus TaxID=285530 RepID=UPI00381D67C4
MPATDDRGDTHGDEPGPFPGSGGSEAGAIAGPDNVSGSFGAPGDEPRRTAEREDRGGRERRDEQDREVGHGREAGHPRETRHPSEVHPAREAGHPGESDQVRVSDVIAEGVRGADPREIPGKLCVAAVRLLPVADASVSLRSNGMPVQLSASSARAAHLSDLQATLGDGPCTSAAETRAAVLATDLTSGRDADRWPVFAQQAAAAGVRAVYAMPLGNDTVCVGTLDLYRDVPGGLTRRELRIAELVASVMTVSLTALARGQENGPEDDDLWLSGLAKAHDEVYQAVGMIMVQLGVDSDEALARLRADAFADGRTATEVAHDVVWHLKRFDRD